jgi:phage-related tail protein
MTKIKDYLRKMVIETVVYTESMKAEIEAIGKAISEGITKGFSETGLHEIRRDLSYVFEQANKAIDKVDTMFDTVFSGYATGTQNATQGLHLVGEAGPELVRFRGGEQVLNAGNTQKVLSDTGRTNNFNVTFNNLQDTSAFAMMQQFKDYQRQMAIDGVF